MRSVAGMVLVGMMALPAVGFAEPSTPVSPTPGTMAQVTVQIGGRFCEYLARRVEAALFGFHPVLQVEFLNDHGTVLVQYDSERVSPGQLVASVEGAISSGIGCRAWVDQGDRQQNGS